MDFRKTEEQELLLESLDELMERHCSEAYLRECDEAHRWPKEFTDILMENGFGLWAFPRSTAEPRWITPRCSW